MSCEGIHDVDVELVAFVIRLRVAAETADGNGIVVSKDDGLLVTRSDLRKKLGLVVIRSESSVHVELESGGVVSGVEANDHPVGILKSEETPWRLESVEDRTADGGIEVRTSAGIHLVIGVESERTE